MSTASMLDGSRTMMQHGTSSKEEEHPLFSLLPALLFTLEDMPFVALLLVVADRLVRETTV